MTTTRKYPDRYEKHYFNNMMDAGTNLWHDEVFIFGSHEEAISERAVYYSARASLREHPDYMPYLAKICDNLRFSIKGSTLIISRKK